MSKDELIRNTINSFHEECSKITETQFIDKIHKHEEIMIKVILEALIDKD